MLEIRKINVGPDLMNSLVYQVGQKVGPHVVHSIEKNTDGGIIVYAINDKNERFPWKELNKHVPVTIEYSNDTL